ncbi:hypothetical protein ACS8FD_04555 [Psychrobacter sp. 1U2]|uniref:hypothetical protein n=1 Tax=Psychrobacter sp. 1U2 TaxID=3453577 RepID=UPI003F46BC53
MAMIGEEIDYGRDQAKGFYRFTWLCCILGIIVFSSLAYIGLVEQHIALGGRYGSPVSHYTGAAAVFHGYFFFSCAYGCFAAGFWYWQFKYLIWILLAVIWLGCLFSIHYFIP